MILTNTNMQKIKMVQKDGSVGEYDAAMVLAHVNGGASIPELQGMKWRDGGKKALLMGKNNGLQVEVAEGLTEAEADQALKEYAELGYA